MSQKDPAAVELAAKRRRVQGACVVCGQPFEGTTKRRYCSHACQQRAYEQRKATDRGISEGKAV
jgi:hypothetical protein